MKQEAIFEKELLYLCPTLGWRYIKIPDAKMITAKNRNKVREEKRPFDSIISTPEGLIAIECKYNYNKLEAHQYEIGEYITHSNGMFFVLRKVDRQTGTAYIIEDYEGKKLSEMPSCLEMLYKLKTLV